MEGRSLHEGREQGAHAGALRKAEDSLRVYRWSGQTMAKDWGTAHIEGFVLLDKEIVKVGDSFVHH